MLKYLILILIPAVIVSCGKSKSASGSPKAPESKTLINKDNNPSLYELLYQNSCDAAKKATYWFGYQPIQANEPGNAGLRIVLSVQPKGKSISVAYRAAMDSQGFSNGMTLKHDIVSSNDFTVDGGSIDLASEGFRIYEQGDKLFITTTKAIGPIQKGVTTQLVKDSRTDSEILDFIGTMGLYSSDFSLGCGQ